MSQPAVAQDQSHTFRCARHPGTETVLRCGRCETPICPRCMIHTPVGARCPTCARVKRFAFVLKPAELARVIAFGILVGAGGTVVVTFVPFLGPLIGFAIVGFGVGQAVLVGANRKRARELAPIAVACLFVGFELGFVALAVATGSLLDLRLFVAPVLLALRQLQLIVGLGLGALLAWMRVR
jgi:hypothetical protein